MDLENPEKQNFKIHAWETTEEKFLALAIHEILCYIISMTIV